MANKKQIAREAEIAAKKAEQAKQEKRNMMIGVIAARTMWRRRRWCAITTTFTTVSWITGTAA